MTRYPIFDATTRKSNKDEKNISIYEDDEKSLVTTRRLHQKHLDLLMLLFKEPKKSIADDGCLYVHTSWYKLAQQMGYSNAVGSTSTVLNYALDLRETTIKHKNIFKTTANFGIIRKFYTDEETKDTIVIIESDFLELFAYEVVYSLLNDNLEKIVNLKDGEIKATIRYFLTQNSMPNGIFFDTLAQKLKRDSSKQIKSTFWRRLKDSKELLSSLGIEIDEEERKLYYKKKDDVVKIDARRFDNDKVMMDILKTHLKSYLDSFYEFKVDGVLRKCKLVDVNFSQTDSTIDGVTFKINYTGLEYEIEIEFTKTKLVSKSNFEKIEYIFRLLAERLVEDDKYNLSEELDI
jgi:hypothetical protein